MLKEYRAKNRQIPDFTAQFEFEGTPYGYVQGSSYVYRRSILRHSGWEMGFYWQRQPLTRLPKVRAFIAQFYPESRIDT